MTVGDNMAALFEDQRQITEMQICFTPITPTHTSEVSLLGRHYFFKDSGGQNNQVSFFLYILPSFWKTRIVTFEKHTNSSHKRINGEKWDATM